MEQTASHGALGGSVCEPCIVRPAKLPGLLIYLGSQTKEGLWGGGLSQPRFQHSSREGPGQEPASSPGSPGTPRMQAVFSITPASFCRGLSSPGAPMSKQPKFTAEQGQVGAMPPPPQGPPAQPPYRGHRSRVIQNS